MPYVSPTAELDTATTRTCSECRAAQPFDRFRPTRSGRSWICEACRRAKAAEHSRRSRARRLGDAPPPRPKLPRVGDEVGPRILHVEHPRAVRVELARLRDRGLSFEQAWPVAVSVGLRDAHWREAIWWRQTLAEQRAWWQAEYDRLVGDTAPSLAEALADVLR